MKLCQQVLHGQTHTPQILGQVEANAVERQYRINCQLAGHVQHAAAAAINPAHGQRRCRSSSGS